MSSWRKSTTLEAQADLGEAGLLRQSGHSEPVEDPAGGHRKQLS
jgi:hypothetical protein